MSVLDDTVGLLRELIAYPTVSADTNLAMIVALADRLSDVGARVQVFNDRSGQKANLIATLGPEVQGGILLSGHSDVVPVTDQDWASDPFEIVQQDGALFGSGTCDMKGFVAAAVGMARQYAALTLAKPVHFAFTCDEEVGCLGAQALIPELQSRGISPDIAIIGEPTEMRVIEGHKGCCEYTTRFSGLEGHESDPDTGVNAVEYAVRYVSRLLELRQTLMARAPDGSRFEPPWSTLNVGRLSGGVAHNVIAGKAKVEWDFRPVQASDMAFVKDTLCAYVETELLPAMRSVCPDADISTETIGEVIGMAPAGENAARDPVAGLLGANGADVVAFGTEAGLFQQMGVDVVVCGPGFIAQAHKADEFVHLEQLEACLSMLERLGQRLN